MKMEICILNSKNVAVIAIILSIISLLFVWMALIGPFKGKLKKLIGEKLFVERFFLLIITLLGLVIIAIAAFCAGIYITYGQMENIWDVISTIASWFGVAASISAVWFAVRVADKQNKIELFEKRYEIYDIVCRCENFAGILKMATTREDMQMFFLLIFCSIPMGERLNDTFFIRMQYISIIDKMGRSRFLFKDQNIEKHLEKLTGALIRVVGASLNISEKNMPYDKILELVNLVNEERHKMLLEVMEKELTLK